MSLEYIWRPSQRTDAPEYYKLLCAVEAIDQPEHVMTVEECYREYDDPKLPPETQTLAAFTPDGKMVALGWVYVQQRTEEEQVAELWGDVHPAHRRRGLGTHILRWQEQRGGEILNAGTNKLPRRFRVGSTEKGADRIALFTRFGYRPIRYFYRMRRDLRQPIPEPLSIEGIRIQKWTPELDAGVMDAFNESFLDHWGFAPITAEQWKIFFSGNAIFNPEATFIASAGGKVVGFAMCSLSEEENSRIGFRQGKIRDVGTLRAWRKRGIASTLMCHSMRVFKEMGLDYAALGVDAENPSGALPIYERLGFVVAKKKIAFTKEIND